MKCSSCGAEIKDKSKFCEYCGTQITVEMQKEQEQLNKEGCPKCGSTNISFTREQHGVVKGKKETAVIHKTVGMCKDCGHTWTTAESNQKKKRIWLWVLGWLCIFPVPLTILLLQKKEMKPAVKYGLIAAAWLVYLLFVFGGKSNNSTTPTSSSENIKVEETSEAQNQEEAQNEIGDTETTESQEMETTEEKQTDKPAEDSSVPMEYRNALAKAESYSTIMHMSKIGVYNQLTSEYGENFEEDAAQYAIEHVVADWNANALAKAEDYSDTMHMSKQGIYDQLISEYGENFTPEEAQYAVDNIHADWNANALAKAKDYSETMSMSKQGIYEQLTSEYGEKFTAEEAQYAVDHME